MFLDPRLREDDESKSRPSSKQYVCQEIFRTAVQLTGNIVFCKAGVQRKRPAHPPMN